MSESPEGLVTGSRRDDLLDGASRLLGRELSLVSRLTGGEHATTVLATDGVAEVVVRRFPPGDDSVSREREVLPRLQSLQRLGLPVPQLVADDPEGSIIITTRVPGGHPDASVPLPVIAEQMAVALSRIHSVSGRGLRPAPVGPPQGTGPAARRAREEWSTLNLQDRVLTHYDFWCGNALWQGERLSGVIDWSGARHAPRGVDVAWCRLDLVLLGSVDAAEVFLERYEELIGAPVDAVSRWDRQAAAQGESRVESWAPNYLGVGRAELTAAVLRQRLDGWIRQLDH